MDFEKYKNPLQYPVSPRRPMLTEPTPEAARKYANDLDQYESDKEAYGQAIRKYRERDAELNAQFKADLLAELGLTDHPKADLFFSLCWSEGHSSGMGDVYNVAITWAELLQ